MRGKQLVRGGEHRQQRCIRRQKTSPLDRIRNQTDPTAGHDHLNPLQTGPDMIGQVWVENRQSTADAARSTGGCGDEVTEIPVSLSDTEGRSVIGAPDRDHDLFLGTILGYENETVLQRLVSRSQGTYRSVLGVHSVRPVCARAILAWRLQADRAERGQGRRGEARLVDSIRAIRIDHCDRAGDRLFSHHDDIVGAPPIRLHLYGIPLRDHRKAGGYVDSRQRDHNVPSGRAIQRTHSECFGDLLTVRQREQLAVAYFVGPFAGLGDGQPATHGFGGQRYDMGCVEARLVDVRIDNRQGSRGQQCRLRINHTPDRAACAVALTQQYGRRIVDPDDDHGDCSRCAIDRVHRKNVDGLYSLR